MQTGHVAAPHTAPAPLRPAPRPVAPSALPAAEQPRPPEAAVPERAHAKVTVDFHRGTGSYVTTVEDPESGTVQQTPAPTLLAMAELAIRRMRRGD